MFPIVVLVGKSGSGKSKIEKELVRRYDWHKVVSFTTRPMRDGEVDGVDYYFISESQFLEYKENKELIEEAEYRGWHYGIHKSQIVGDNINIIVAEPHGHKQIKDKYNNRVVDFYVECDDAERILRMLKREINSSNLKGVVEEIIRRYPNDERDFKEVYRNIKYGVINNDLEDFDLNIGYIYDLTMITSIEEDEDRRYEVRGYLS